MLKLEEGQLAAMKSHAAAGYPNEICGIMIGEIAKGDSPETSTRRVREIVQAANLNTERAADRYEIDPRELLRAEKSARDQGLEVLGYYHSHPDHPCKASVTDYDRSWDGYSYLIISVKGGEPAEHACWIRNPDKRTDYFVEEEIVI